MAAGAFGCVVSDFLCLEQVVLSLTQLGQSLNGGGNLLVRAEAASFLSSGGIDEISLCLADGTYVTGLTAELIRPLDFLHDKSPILVFCQISDFRNPTALHYREISNSVKEKL